MQAADPARGNLIEYWTGGIRRGFNVLILVVLLLIVCAQVRVFMAIVLSPESAHGGWGFILDFDFAFFILVPLGFAGGVLAAWLIGRKAFRPLAWASLLVLIPLGTPFMNLYIARVIGERVVPLLMSQAGGRGPVLMPGVRS